MRNWAENQIDIVLIRHGETKANREHRYLGRTDEGLSKAGRESLAFYLGQGLYPKVRQLFTSPMRRCLQTAAILYPDLTPVVIPEWMEMDFGQFEYKNYEELKCNAQYQSWIASNGILPFAGGESRKNFTARCEQGFVRMCQNLELAGREGIVGLVVHGGTIMALLSSHGGGDYFDYQCANGKGYLCRMKGLGSSARIVGIEALWDTA